MIWITMLNNMNLDMLPNPKGKTNHSKNPKGMANADFSVSLGQIGISQYPLTKSRVEKFFALANLSNKMSMLRSGPATVLVIAFNFWK